MTSHLSLGRKGEEKAAYFLKKQGFTILETNYRFKRAEIDLICQKGELLVFVEVKTRRNTTFGYPEESVSKRKVKKVLQAADEYLAQKDWIHRVRFDVIAIYVQGKRCSITHFPDAF